MSRFVKPEAGGLARFSEKLIESGDGAWYPVIGTGATLGTIGGGTFGLLATEHPLFALLFLPALFFLTTVFSYVTGTVNLGYYANDPQFYKSARYKHWPKLQGTELESMAKPLMLQIYNCTIENHPGSQYGKKCTLCLEREKAMKELIPNKPSDLSDLNTVKRYLEMRKEAEVEHAKAMKELMP